MRTNLSQVAAAVQSGDTKCPVCVIDKQIGMYKGNVTVAPTTAPLVGQPKPFKG
jgi:hypothetical protein